MNKLSRGKFKLKTSPYRLPTQSLLRVKYWSHYRIFIWTTWAEYQLLQYYYSSIIIRTTWAWAAYQLLPYYYYDIIVTTTVRNTNNNNIIIIIMILLRKTDRVEMTDSDVD